MAAILPILPILPNPPVTADPATLPSPCTGAPGALPLEWIAVLGALVPAMLRRDGDMLVVQDASDGAYVYADAAMLAWLDRSLADVVGRRAVDLFEPGMASALRAAEQSALAQVQALASDHRFEWHGTRAEFSVLRQRVDDGGGRRLLATVWRDMAAQRQREAQYAAAIAQLEVAQRAAEQLRRELHDPTLRDGQTGLYNRAHFDDQLRREVDLSTREHREFALVAIELDPLSPETAALGDTARLRILEALGRLLRGNTRAMDASCRFDETRFGVLLSGVGLATAHARMEGLRRQCATQIVAHEGQSRSFTVSMGVASFPHTAHSQDELRVACDGALADARKRGGNRVTLASIRFDPA